ncbi:alcohol dehydrogenase catalytic domain-containing protein [Zhihengliuella halotolerans]|uniref:alcohol dehydrogenase catalytic domain-containing protein n=1 Tax=Zhihengliuella halotolerans TaxID=370736 RepID=UPI003BF8A9ED
MPPQRKTPHARTIDRFSAADDLHLIQIPSPEAGSGEVLIRALSSAVIPVDHKTRNGDIENSAPPLPFTLGWELAGIVI